MDDSPRKFNRSDLKLCAVVALLIAIATAFVWTNYSAAFPQASLDLPLTRAQIGERAKAFLASRGLATAGYREMIFFEPDDRARFYLERELGLERANELMSGPAPVWRWRVRWFRPPDEEELRVWLRPDGRLVQFEHHIREAAEGRRIDRPSARLIAEAFLRSQTSDPQKLVLEESEERPHRSDHNFVWEQENFRAGEATLRRSITIHGDRIGEYQEYLHVPEAWVRDFSKLRSSNQLYAGIAQGLYLVLALASLGAAIYGLRKRLIIWKPLLLISGVVAGLYLLNEANTLEFALDDMSTASGYLQMVLLALLDALGGCAGVFLYVLAPAAAGIALYKRAFPSQLHLEEILTLRGLSTRSYFRAVVAGFGLAACHMVFLTAFYLIGARFGVWSPQDVDYSDVLATPIPWIYPVSIASMAACAEEFWFRLLAIPLLLRFLPRWPAIVIPAFIWGFLHANYPQQPGYIRGIEVGMIGIAAGWMLVRYGIVTTLVWHYSIDAFLIGMFLLRGGNWVYWLHASVVGLLILAPLGIGVVLYRRNGGFAEQSVRERPPPPVVTETRAEHGELGEALRPPLSARYLIAVGAVVAVLALVLRPEPLGDFVQFKVTRAEAEAKARAEMESRKLAPASWRSASRWLENVDTLAAEYLRQQAGYRAANEKLESSSIAGVWEVRFFRPLQAEEWRFYINSKGELYRRDHILDEKAAGASLAADQARAQAEQYVASLGIPVAGWKLVEAQEHKRDHRTDHSFVWEDPVFRVGEARLRVSVEVIGDVVTRYRRFLKLPEEWVRTYTKPRVWSFLVPAFGGAVAVPVVIALIRRIGSPGHRIRWRLYAVAAAAALVAVLLEQLNQAPLWMASYNTTTPLENYYGQLIAWLASIVLLMAGAVFAGSMTLDGYLQMAFGDRRLPVPAIWRAALVAIVLLCSGSLREWLHQQVPGPHPLVSVEVVPGIDTAIPAIDSFAGAFQSSLTAIGLAAIVIAAGVALLNRRGWTALITAALLALAFGRAMSMWQVPLLLLDGIFLFSVVALLLATCAVDLASIGVGMFWAGAAARCWDLIEQPSRFAITNGAVVALAAALAGVALILWLKPRLATPRSP